MLEEGYAIRPSDIDVVMVYGYGWPVYTGGPMHWADQVGLSKIVLALDKYAKQFPGVEYFKVADSLRRLASSGSTLADYWKKNSKL